MTDEEVLDRPIGWWLKEADARLTAAFERALEGTSVDRRGWQVLESLAGGPVVESELVAALSAFDTAEVLRRVLADLRGRGWVETAVGALRLSAEGRRQHAALAPVVGRVRQQVRTALPQEEYVQLVRLLARLTEAL